MDRATVRTALSNANVRQVGRLRVIAAVGLLALAAWVTRVGTRWPQLYCMTDGSMEPSLHEGECFVVVSPAGRLRPGDVVLFQLDIGEERYAVPRRIAGLPGDTVTLLDGAVTVNGTPASWPFAIREPHQRRSRLAREDSLLTWIDPWVVTPDSLLLLADTRDMAGWPDSRFLGLVPASDVFARATITLTGRRVR